MPTAERGAGGPLNVAELRDPNPATVAFLRAAAEVGIPRNDDVNGAEQDGVNATQVTQKRGRRWSAADAYLKPARKRRNLTVETGRFAQRVRFEGHRAVGVDYVVDGQPRRADAAREVILSGGAINSPQLLMLSGVGPADQLRDHGIPVVHELPGVGQHLLDHLAVVTIVECKEPVTLAAAESLPNVARFLVSGRGMLTSNVAEACAFVRTRDGLPAPDLELVFAPVTFLDHGLEPPTDHGLTIGAVALQPRSAGTLTLASADPSRPPIIDPALSVRRRWRRSPSARRGHAPTRARSSPRPRSRATPASRRIRRPRRPTTPRLPTTSGATRESLYHPVGTCMMGRRSRRGRRPRPPSPRPRAAPGRRRLGDADDPAGPHARLHGHDRREGFRSHQRRPRLRGTLRPGQGCSRSITFTVKIAGIHTTVVGGS